MPGRPPNQLDDKQLSWLHVIGYWISIQALWLWLNTCYRMKVTGRGNIPKGPRRFIVAANHKSMLDIPVVAVSLNFMPIAFMSKQELFTKTPAIVREYFRAMAAFAVNREKVEVSTIKSALKVMKSDRWALGIFPEGTRGLHLNESEAERPKVRENKKGIAFIAKSGKAAILPVGVAHGDKRRISVYIGELMPHDPALDVDGLSQRIQQSLEAMVDRAEDQLD